MEGLMEIRGITFTHPGATSQVLHGVSFTTAPGGITAILGPNGSGKTTIFNCISGIWTGNSGEVLFRGDDISRKRPHERAGIISVVPQHHEPAFPYTVFQAVLMGRAPHIGMFSAPSKKDRETAAAAIETMGLSALKERAYTRLSGGERQMVLIARAVAQDTPVMILDEPTSHLDIRNQVMVLDMVHSIARTKGVTVLMTVHDPNLALIYADQVVLLNRGAVAASGRPGRVISPKNLRTVYGDTVKVINAGGERSVRIAGRRHVKG